MMNAMTTDPRIGEARKRLAAMHAHQKNRFHKWLFFTVTLPAFLWAVWFALRTFGIL